MTANGLTCRIHHGPITVPESALCSRWPTTWRMGEDGRVGVWRGGCRPNISVAAPFVWRCLTGSTLAPFPHSAHRTGHADLSGSAAIAGFCPHGSRRAALPQRALQGGPEAGRSSVPSLMDNRFGEREYGQEPVVRRPGTWPFWLRFPSVLRQSLTTQVWNARRARELKMTP